jgi:dipeptidyl aminopeptidase/acylaminoacyl peptidase
VWSVRLTPDGDRLLTAGSDQTARTFSLPGGAELARFSVGGAAQCASWSGDGSRLATGAPGEVTVWSAGGHKLAAFGGLPGDTTAVAFDASTSRVAATSGRVARVWRLADGALLGELGPHDETVEAVAFSLDGARVATAGDDRTARIWRLPSRLEASGHAESPLAAIAFSPDGARVAAAGDDRSITLWDAATGRVVSVWEGETDAATAVAFGPGGAIAATGAFDGEVMLWSAGDGKLLDRWRAHGGEMVSAVAFSADGEALATGGRDGFARVWPLPRNRLSADEVARVARCRSPFRIDGQRLTRGAIDAAACR